MNRPWTEFPFERALDGIRAAGFAGFGLLRHGGRQLISPDSSVEEAAKVAETIRQHGLHLLMIPNFITLDRPDDAALAATQRQIDHCHRLGVQVLLEMGVGRPEQYDRYVAIMREAAPYAQERGIMIAIKPHGGLSRTTAGTLEAVRLVDHPAYRICFDPGNLVHGPGEQPHESIREMAPYTVAMCIKDTTGSARDTVMVTPGQGEIDFRTIFGVLRDHGFAGPAVVETLGTSSAPEDVDHQATQAYHFLASLLASL